MTIPSDPAGPSLKPVKPLDLSAQQNFFVPPDAPLISGSLQWMGREENAVFYQGVDLNQEPCRIFFVHLISEDEKIIFRAFQDWYSGALKKLSDTVKGYYTFEVLRFLVEDVPRSWNEFSGLLARHAAKLSVAEKNLIQFGSLWGVLERHTEADFGRVESKLKTDFFKPRPDSVVRQFKKRAEQINLKSRDILIFGDGSSRTFFDDPDQLKVFENLPLQKSVAAKGACAFFWHLKSNRRLRI